MRRRASKQPRRYIYNRSFKKQTNEQERKKRKKEKTCFQAKRMFSIASLSYYFFLLLFRFSLLAFFIGFGRRPLEFESQRKTRRNCFWDRLGVFRAS